jgi:hypothetical protein
MIFEQLIAENKEAFLSKVKDIASFLGIDPNWLMFVMWFETAHTLSSHIQNRIKATGLIQFMPQTAIGLGTTVEDLKAMSNVEQLDFVKKHLAPFRGRYKNFVDLYCAIFWPAAVGKDDSYRITSDQVAVQNPIFDINKDKDIEKSEIRAALLKQIPKGYETYFA